MSIMQIETGIPAPVKRDWKAQLDKMEIDQSAKISIDFYNTVKAAISQHFHADTEKRFTTAKESNGFRVWRIA